MTPDPIDSPASTAIQQLQAFGLSTYASRMFVALLRNGVSTARGVSEVADVPRTRVYDAAEELVENDLIAVEEQSPKHFDPVPARDAIRKLRQEYRYREATLTAVLSMIESENDDEADVRTVTGQEEVVRRLVDVVRAATEEVILVTDGTPLSDELLDRLSEAAEEGIQVRIVGDVDGDDGGDGDEGEDRAAIATRTPDVETVTRIPETTDIPYGKRLLVDGTQAVVTVSVGRDQSSDPTLAVWGTGERNLLVEMLKDALTEWFDDDTVSPGRSE